MCCRLSWFSSALSFGFGFVERVRQLELTVPCPNIIVSGARDTLCVCVKSTADDETRNTRRAGTNAEIISSIIGVRWETNYRIGIVASSLFLYNPVLDQ